MPFDVCPTKELEGIGVSATRHSPSIDTETLLAASYGIITGRGQFNYNRNDEAPHFDHF
jgi:hypothetical protein